MLYSFIEHHGYSQVSIDLIILFYSCSKFSAGIWTIIRGWLDPVVAAKVNFTKTAEDLEIFLPKNQVSKEIGGESDYNYTYIEPETGENSKADDKVQVETLVSKRSHIVTELESATASWIKAAKANDEKSSDIKKERDRLAYRLAANYWDIDPYVRARCLYDRNGTIKPPTSTALSRKGSVISSVSEKRDSSLVPREASAKEIANTVAA